MLRAADGERFQTTCTTCARSSPACDAPVEAARETLKKLGWAFGVGDDWLCPVCATRSTRNLKR